MVVNFDYNGMNDHVKVSNEVSEGQLFEMTSKRLGFTGFDAGKIYERSITVKIKNIILLEIGTYTIHLI